MFGVSAKRPELVDVAETFPIMDPHNNKQSEQRRNKEADAEEHDRLGHDTTL